MAPRGSPEHTKVAAMRESRCLNPRPGQVRDEAFLAGDFFDARDAVQVKYEMVRRVSVDGAPVTATAAAFGYSPPSYYQAAAALAASGLDGLVPAKPGPRGGHKLTGQILTWAEHQLAADPALKTARPPRPPPPLPPTRGPPGPVARMGRAPAPCPAPAPPDLSPPRAGLAVGRAGP